MKIVCDSCAAKYSIADEKVAGKVFKIRCKKCTSVIVVRGDQVPAEEQEAATQVFDYGSDAIWHIVIDGDQQGPYSPAQLGEMLTNGSIDWEVYVWQEGLDGWKAARDVPELVAAITGEPQESAPADAGYDQGAAAGFDAGDAAGFDAGAAAPAAAAAPADMGADPFGGSADPFAGGGDAFGADAADPFGGGDGAFAAGGAFGGGAAEAAPAASAGADLFAPADPDSSPFGGGGDADVVASASPRVSEADAKMTGQRNENSVLFSLSNLQALATGSSSSSSGTTPSPMASSAPAGHASGEGSGLIDIRALAAATGTTGGGGVASGGGGADAVDDLLSIGGGGGLGSTLGAPVLAPAAKEEKKGKGMMIGLVAAAVAVLGLLVAVVILLSRTPEPVAANTPATAAQPAGLGAAAAPGATPTPNAPPAPAAPPGAATAAEAPTPNAPPGAATAEPEAAAETSGNSGGARRGNRHHRGGSGSAPSAASMSTDSAPSMAPTMRARSGGLDDLMADVLGGMGGMSTSSMMSTPMAANLPESPARDAVRSALQSVTSAVARCGNGQHGVAMTAISFRGSTGRVSSARVSGQFAGTPVGSCVARAVRRAHVPRFSRSSFSVNFPFRI